MNCLVTIVNGRSQKMPRGGEQYLFEACSGGANSNSPDNRSLNSCYLRPNAAEIFIRRLICMATYFLSDPTVATVLVVGADAMVAGLAWSRANAVKRLGEVRHERRMLAVALLFSILALSYQLEFIPQTIALAKGAAKNSGWYNYRWPLAMVVLITFVGTAGLAIASYRPKVWRWPASLWLLGIGGTLLTGYFLLRATSLHWVEPWSGIHLGCPQTNPWIEVFSACVVAMGLWLAPLRTGAEANFKGQERTSLRRFGRKVRSRGKVHS